MWLLDTHTLRLHHFESPEAVEEGYAILSHVWGAQELSFQELQEITGWCERSGGDPHAFVTTKISRFCQLAELHGYKWAWIDTCCIDKTSSAEVSETLNAMFRYYSVAKVCYAYLSETTLDILNKIKEYLGHPEFWKDEQFSRDPWHRRGWTLQELIAPRNVHFLSDTWEFLGSKIDFADGLERITGVPAGVLKFERQLKDVSIVQRMSWASKRKTTRPEDEAYCLMGIFNVSMPTLYGEGRNAFRRLQEEILKRSADTTLFAWGGCCDMVDLRSPPGGAGPAGTGLFALSPSDFNINLKHTRTQRESRPGGTIMLGSRRHRVGIPLFRVARL